MARGADATIDPRVAPQGTIVRVQNMRIDKLGRLVPRKGYVSLGTTVQSPAGSGPLVPHDLYTLEDSLICAGNHSTQQTGTHALYKYQNQVGAVWRTEFGVESSEDPSAAFRTVPAADSIRIVSSALFAAPSDIIVADCAALSDGTAVAIVYTSSVSSTAIMDVINPTTGRIIKRAGTASGTNPRVLAIGTVFYLFYQPLAGTTIEVRTLTTTTQADISAATTVATGTSAAPLFYDVANYEGTTDYLLAFPTGTGYSWTRRSSAHAVVTGPTAVVSLANAPVSICGSTGENISVLNVRTTSGAELRTFNFSTAALAVGPTNLDTSGNVMDWVGLCRFSATEVYFAMHTTAPAIRVYKGRATIAAHTRTSDPDSHNTRPASKPLMVNSEVFMWEALGSLEPAPYGLTRCSATTTALSEFLSGVALDGAARVTYSATTIGYVSQIAKGSGPNYYAALVSLDPRDKTYRANLLEFGLNTGRRRQGVQVGGSLLIAGGTTIQWDGKVSAEIGFETAPRIISQTAQLAGGLTLLGAYTYQCVFRSVASNGDVSQSAPSAPSSATLTGGNQGFVLVVSNAYSARRYNTNAAQGSAVFVDMYRTEAGGSIPRLIRSVDATAFSGYGAQVTITDTATDATQQTGVALYTQGADGSVSGRLPLGMASPGTLIAESNGRVFVGGTERRQEVHFSIEGRPGEPPGFVNDNLFFVKNQLPVTAVVAGDGGRRYIFSAQNVRELVGEGPNAAGVGEISEPVEIENRVGAVDWRSVCKTEHGVFFQSSALGEPKIYLLPAAGGGAIDAGRGIQDLLTLYPVVTSATRHDEDQLLTFTLQNNAGTDGRIVHLDLETSGMGPGGWQGMWLVDRLQELEATQFPEVIEQRIDLFPFVAAGGTVTVQLPRGKRIGDMTILSIAAQGTSVGGQAIGTPTSASGTWTVLVGSAADSPFGRVATFSQFATSSAISNNQTASFTVATATVVQVKVWLIRGANNTLPECSVQSYTSLSTAALATLTPSWGAAATLWLSHCESDLVFSVPNTGQIVPLIGQPPIGFGGTQDRPHTIPGNAATVSVETMSAFSQQNVASLSGLSWILTSSTSGIASMVAVRPQTTLAAGTPCRSSVAYQGRLVVCNSTLVLQSSPTVLGDISNRFVETEWESADFYPMGAGGAGRHLWVSILGEVLGPADIVVLLSYDGGFTWTELRKARLIPAFTLPSGGEFRMRWVPKRRKIERVRVRVTSNENNSAGTPNGASLSVAYMKLSLGFEDLIGPVRGRGYIQGRNQV